MDCEIGGLFNSNGTVPGHVVRIDPASVNETVTIDIALDAPPPRGARPDLGVDGTITSRPLRTLSVLSAKPAPWPVLSAKRVS